MDAKKNARLLAVLKKNEIFGEMGLIDNQPRSATAVALENCELTLIRDKTIGYLMKNDPFALRPLLRVLSQRLRETTRQLYSH
ncbi:MAG: cyclic nucleotide-binding domain-containing protein [Nitrospinae bacterium]|nr:cyclic nucleotide-binding domain-containing protein [Nitrospinota bacterium]